MVRHWLGIIPALALSGQAFADQYHYQNVLIGDRAMGMGGAFGAVADDASGVYYNPAGIAFALSNDVSGSANANVTKKITYKNAFGGEDFVENSSGAFPAFFGGLQKLDSINKKLVFAFGLYTVDGELRDQDDLVTNRTHTSQLENGQTFEQGIVRFHRTNNVRATTAYAGGALGYRLANNMAVGMGLSYVTIDELTQDYQDVHRRFTVEGQEQDRILTQNIRNNLSAFGIQATLGFQMTFSDRFSFGFTHKVGSYVSQSFEGVLEKREISLLTEDGKKVENGESIQSGVSYSPVISDVVEIEDPLGAMPAETRLAFAWFASTRALATFDIVHYGGVANAAPINYFPLSAEAKAAESAEAKSERETLENKLKMFNKEAVTNFHLGLEYYIQPAVPLRLGLFTNNTNTPEIDPKKSGQLDHVDFIGQSIFLAWVQPNSQIGAGLILQQGSGQSQKTGDYAVQDVEANIFTFAFSATHSF